MPKMGLAEINSVSSDGTELNEANDVIVTDGSPCILPEEFVIRIWPSGVMESGPPSLWYLALDLRGSRNN